MARKPDAPSLEADAEGCCIDIAEGDVTPDAELPVAAGGVAADAEHGDAEHGDAGHADAEHGDDELDGCGAASGDIVITTDEELPAASGGVA